MFDGETVRRWFIGRRRSSVNSSCAGNKDTGVGSNGGVSDVRCMDSYECLFVGNVEGFLKY